MKSFAVGVGLFMVFLALACFARGDIGSGIVCGLLAWGAFAFGSGSGGGPPKYRYKGSTHHFERMR